MYHTAFLDLPALKRVQGEVALPGSKSISNRVLLLSALCEGTTEVRDLLHAQGAEPWLLSPGQFDDFVRTYSLRQAALVKAFATSAAGATGLKQTYDGAMKAMTGGATGLNVALLLG